MRKRYGLISAQYPDFLTHRGRIITHHDRAQMEWLHPGAKVVELPPHIPAAACEPILHHPDYLGAFDANGDVVKGAFRDQS
jgi:hypothetical protein